MRVSQKFTSDINTAKNISHVPFNLMPLKRAHYLSSISAGIISLPSAPVIVRRLNDWLLNS